MSYQLWLSFILATILIDLTPGPAMMLVIGITASQGIRNGIKTITGAQIAELVWFTASVTAMLSAYELSDKLLGIISVFGAMYLFYLGLRSFIHLPDIFSFLDFRKKLSIKYSAGTKIPPAFSAGFMTQIANPKSYLYWLAFLPQFQPASGPTLKHNLYLLAVVTIIDVSTLALCAHATHRTRSFLTSKKWQHRLEHLSGGVLMAIGAWMLAHYFKIV